MDNFCVLCGAYTSKILVGIPICTNCSIRIHQGFSEDKIYQKFHWFRWVISRVPFIDINKKEFNFYGSYESACKSITEEGTFYIGVVEFVPIVPTLSINRLLEQAMEEKQLPGEWKNSVKNRLDQSVLESLDFRLQSLLQELGDYIADLYFPLRKVVWVSEFQKKESK